MFGKKSPDVLVVGAGPVGMLSALLLVKRGIPVKIIDKEERKAGHSYALGLHPASLKLLDEVGLLDKILEECYKIRTIGLFDHDSRRSELRLSPLEEDFSFLAVISQNALERVLEEELKKNGVTVMWNHRLSTLEPHHSHVSVAVDKLVSESMGYAVAHTEKLVGKTLKMEVPFVIGADGYSSIVRRLSQIDFNQVGDSHNFAVYEFVTDVDLKNDSVIALDENSTNVLWPLSHNRCRWGFQLTDVTASNINRDKGRLAIFLGQGRYPWLSTDFLKTMIQERAPWFKGNIDQVYWSVVVCFEHRLVSTYGRGHVWLAGDAAHLTGPVGMQSMNVGLREAYTLSSNIADILGSGGSRDLLAEYNENQIHEWNVLHGMKGGLKGNSNTDPWISQFSDRLLSCLPGSCHDLPALAKQLNLDLV